MCAQCWPLVQCGGRDGTLDLDFVYAFPRDLPPKQCQLEKEEKGKMTSLQRGRRRDPWRRRRKEKWKLHPYKAVAFQQLPAASHLLTSGSDGLPYLGRAFPCGGEKRQPGGVVLLGEGNSPNTFNASLTGQKGWRDREQEGVK